MRSMFVVLLFFIASIDQVYGLNKSKLKDSEPVRAEIVAARIATTNELRVGVKLKMAPGWHIYSQQPGDIGLPTTVDWQSSGGITIAALPWPVAENFEYQGIKSTGYAEEVTLWAKVSAEKTKLPESFKVDSHITWLACNDDCRPGEVSLKKQINVSKTSVIQEIAPILDQPTQAQTQPTHAFSLAFLSILWFAFLGGIILNIMPCVFPVLSLKIMGLTMTHDARGMKMHAIAYGVGVMLSFWGLALLLNILRSFGTSVGWGFQFQSPNFVFCLIAIVFAIALNMVGLYEFGAGIQNKAGSVKIADGMTGAFLSGVLATALATPCTGPFMGSAIAASLTMSGMMTFLIFTALGSGMALPYMTLCWYPSFRRFMPRPGAWMEIFKQLLAFPLFLTVVWLLWVLGCQVGVDGLSRALISLVLLGLVCWGFGRFCSGQCTRIRQRMITAAAVCLGLTSIFIGAPWSGYVAESSSVTASVTQPKWEKFSSARLAELRKTGVPIIIDFTAAWCIVCQVNERRIFNSNEIVEPLIKSGAVFLRADWTKQDPEISEELSRHGAAGVPLVVVYDKNGNSSSFSSLIEPTTFAATTQKLALNTNKSYS